ncbi:MAG: HDOD domain-containing protein [Chloroflexi bacterium]|nr:HDOD domain-containing protein [Chloroflexota bacterium]
MSQVFIGRQPIFNRKLQVSAYELLYRTSSSDRLGAIDHDYATSQILVQAFSGFGLARLVGNRVAFINLTESFIYEAVPIPVPPYGVVLEIPETLPINARLLEALTKLAARGYKLALDDVVDPLSVRPLLSVVHFVKLDLIGMSRLALQKNARFLKSYNLQVIAEKVETQEDYQFCRWAGVHLFQGFFFSKPKIIQEKQVNPSRLVLLHLISKVQDPETDFLALEKIIAQDVSLSYKLLRLANSAYYGIPNKVESIRHAIALIGLDTLKAWFTVFLLADTEEKPRELTVTALVRARMCELLAHALHKVRPETSFLTGLLSIMDAFFDLPLEKVLAALPVTTEVRDALLHHTGALGEILHIVLLAEKSEGETIQAWGYDTQVCWQAYLAAIQWAAEVEKALTS